MTLEHCAKNATEAQHTEKLFQVPRKQVLSKSGGKSLNHTEN